jgi:hypothetical protein
VEETGGLNVEGAFATSAAKGTKMRAEIQTIVDDIEQALSLLRRHL